MYDVFVFEKRQPGLTYWSNSYSICFLWPKKYFIQLSNNLRNIKNDQTSEEFSYESLYSYSEKGDEI